MKSIVSVTFIFYFLISSYAQSNSSTSTSISFHTNENVKNSKEDYFQQIEKNWKAYLNSQEYVKKVSAYWNNSVMAFSDYPYISLLLDLKSISKNSVQYPRMYSS